MEVPTAMLVALMFVTILSISIGNLLMTLAARVSGGADAARGRIWTAWAVLLLLIHLDDFWSVTEVLRFEEWEFEEFLFIIAGPILLLFASTVLSETESETDAPTLLPPRFFVILAIIQAWGFGVNLLMLDSLPPAGIAGAITILVFLWLATTRSVRHHMIGTACAWALFAFSSAHKIIA